MLNKTQLSVCAAIFFVAVIALSNQPPTTNQTVILTSNPSPLTVSESGFNWNKITAGSTASKTVTAQSSRDTTLSAQLVNTTELYRGYLSISVEPTVLKANQPTTLTFTLHTAPYTPYGQFQTNILLTAT